MIIVFLGPPGAGKGTQAEKLAQLSGTFHLSTGQMLRDAMTAETKIGLQAADYMQKGLLVPDELMIDVVREWFSSNTEKNGAILDGFPRTVAQAIALDEVLSSEGKQVHCVVYFFLEADEIRSRLSQRGRLDDSESAVERRLQVYHEQTRPLVDYYRQQGLLKEIDGIGTPEEVFERVRTATEPE